VCSKCLKAVNSLPEFEPFNNVQEALSHPNKSQNRVFSSTIKHPYEKKRSKNFTITTVKDRKISNLEKQAVKI